MNTPIVDFVKNYAASGVSRLHMPGHKGQSFLGCERFDITEVKGADVLYDADGIIAESENIASDQFKTAHTFYSTEGSSLCIKAMLAIATNGKSRTVLAARNAHKAFLYGAALLDLNVEWLYSDINSHMCSCVITPELLKDKLNNSTELPSAVYITSPDYLGNIQDIKGIADVCHAFNVQLLIDNAHGAYLGFLKISQHPIHLGADMCCDSAHKTLPVLTGGAYLHIGKTAPNEYLQNARRFLSLFASTSPSYLTLQSLDLCNCYLAEYSEKLQRTVEKVNTLKEKLVNLGWLLIGDEALKITLNCSAVGHNGEQVAQALRENNIECEFADRNALVLMFTPETDDEAYKKIKATFEAIKPQRKTEVLLPQIPKPERKMSIRQAMFAQQETVSVSSAVGYICATPRVSCPPAVSPIFSGELITDEVVKVLKFYNIETIDIIKKE